MFKKEFNLFEIQYYEEDLDYIDTLISNLQEHYQKIMDFFEIKEFSKKVIIQFWNDAQKYRDYFNQKYQEMGEDKTVPLWEVARSFTDKNPCIYLISYEECKKCMGHENDSLEQYMKLILHEFVHTCQFEFNQHQPSLTWFQEALATNLAEQYDSLKLTASLEEILKGSVHYINYYTMGKYVLENYDKESILHLARDKDFLTKETPKIYQETKEYLERRVHTLS